MIRKPAMAAAILLISGLARADEPCKFKGVPEVIAKGEHETHEVWEMEDEPFLWSKTAPEIKAFGRYLKWATGLADPAQGNLIRMQRTYFAPYPNMVQRFDLFLDGKVGTFLDARCFEMFLLAQHTSRFPLEQRPSEYMAFVLRNPENFNRLRVYFSSGDLSPDFSPPSSNEVLTRIESDLSQGWSLDFHLHSHPFMSQVYPDFLGGTVVPSDGDITSYQYWAENIGMKEAWLTNGLTTVKIPKSQFTSLLETVPGVH